MIATLTGVVAEKLPDAVVLDVGGIGYGLFVTREDYGALAQGERTKVYVYEHIREQQHDLFAFHSLDSKRLFEQLMTVSGVGPKMALSVMSVGNVAQVRSAIARGDLEFIQQASGVGKRVAERIVVELKDKVGLEGAELSDIAMLQSTDALLKDEAAEALVALGYSPQDAAQALQAIDKDLATEERVRRALQGGNHANAHSR